MPGVGCLAGEGDISVHFWLGHKDYDRLINYCEEGNCSLKRVVYLLGTHGDLYQRPGNHDQAGWLKLYT